jgi:hypothetical protein
MEEKKKNVSTMWLCAVSSEGEGTAYVVFMLFSM